MSLVAKPHCAKESDKKFHAPIPETVEKWEIQYQACNHFVMKGQLEKVEGEHCKMWCVQKDNTSSDLTWKCFISVLKYHSCLSMYLHNSIIQCQNYFITILKMVYGSTYFSKPFSPSKVCMLNGLVLCEIAIWLDKTDNGNEYSQSYSRICLSIFCHSLTTNW
jgi:hypothetical protein